jgi:hypothetical protein
MRLDHHDHEKDKVSYEQSNELAGSVIQWRLHKQENEMIIVRTYHIVLMASEPAKDDNKMMYFDFVPTLCCWLLRTFCFLKYSNH